MIFKKLPINHLFFGEQLELSEVKKKEIIIGKNLIKKRREKNEDEEREMRKINSRIGVVQ